MEKKELINSIYQYIENCSSLEYIYNLMYQHEDLLTKEEILRIINYYLSLSNIFI